MNQTLPHAPPSITHRQLAMFRAIMLHGNLSRAAEVCASSQPTLSRELARLEQLLGFALFDRVRGRLRPTVRALALMQEVERSFVGLEQIAIRAQELRLQATGRLRLACLPALAHALVGARGAGAFCQGFATSRRERVSGGIPLAGAGHERTAL